MTNQLHIKYHISCRQGLYINGFNLLVQTPILSNFAIKPADICLVHSLA